MGIHPEQLNLSGKRITIMGLGHFGGNIAAIRYLHQKGARLCITDLKSKESLKDSLDKISDCNPESIHLGSHRESDFVDTDLIVVSPAVPPTNHLIQFAINNQIPVTTELNLFWQINPAPVIAVTGSNGKSTTSAMIHSILLKAGYRSHLGGNIGKSLLGKVHEINEDDIIVLELSSFQLEYLSTLNPAPLISVITNFSPNHLDWHGSLENYQKAKQNISKWQDENQFTVIPENDGNLSSWKTSAMTISVPLNNELKNSVSIPGEHNLWNATLASAATSLLNVSKEDISEGLKKFNSLPHRLEKVLIFKQREFYNDSLATTPESSIAAIRSFDNPVYLIAGGYDKQVDLKKFSDEISKNVLGVALIGDTAEIISQHLKENQNMPSTILEKTEVCPSLETAIQKVWSWSSPKSVILLSPGCASYDQFSNFEERGDCFKKLVQKKAESGT
jgi:UDP-N-acetylmuramoylalanine--D-glutamate ligase